MNGDISDFSDARQVDDAIVSYRPRASSAPDVAELFPQVQPLVVEAVRASRPARITTARTRMSHVARFVTWLATSSMWRPDRGPVPFTPTMVAGYVQTVNETASVRAQLAVVGRAFQPEHWVAHPAPSDVGPYTLTDVEALWQGACAVRHDRDDVTVAATVAAVLGAGLNGDDLAVVKARHVDRDPDGHVYVTVNGAQGRDRTVPVARRWASRLVATLDGVPPDMLLIGGKERPDGSVTVPVTRRAYTAGLTPFSVRRMRTTWLTDRLNDGVPIDVLMRYSAIRSGHTFDRLLEFVRARPTEIELAVVRGDVRR